MATTTQSRNLPADRIVPSTFSPGIQISEIIPSPTRNQLDVALDERLSCLVVDVSVTHPDASELVVTLISPDNTRVVLHDRRAGVNLRTSYPTLTAPAESLSTFFGKPSRGLWTLELYDAVENTNQGTLDLWILNFCAGFFLFILDEL